MPFLLAVFSFVLLMGCSSLSVKPLDPTNPAGLPFYLTKPMQKVTKIKYEFFKIPNPTLIIYTTNTMEKEIINVIDTTKGYTLNHLRPFSGESKLKIERSAGSSTQKSSSTDIAKIEVEDKEGITEFLKGVVEGAKTLSEIAEKLKPPVAPAGAFTDGESTYFSTLAAKDIGVYKSIVSVDFLPL